MTGGTPQPAADAARALSQRAPRRAEIAAAFHDVERQAHRLLPELAALRPAVGGTPIIAVPSEQGCGRVWLKLESANTTGTIKARTAYALLCTAVARAGAQVRIVEYSGGSLAVALAEFCALLGIDLHMVVPHGAPERLRRTLRGHGARVSAGRPGTGFLGALDEAVRVAAAEERYLLLQHCAAEAAAMHREHTGAEIADQLAARGVAPAVLAATVGSGGTALGVALALRERWPDCAALAVFPAEAPYGDPSPPDSTPRMNGTGGLGHGLPQPLLAPYEDRFTFRTVGYRDALHAMRHLRSAHGLAVSSSGAGAWLQASRELDRGPAGRDAVAVVAGRGTIEEWAHAAGD
ncbi:pyridoxal-phosphate dependent enzyme [Streptantibioticus ferralitis]|uniref:Pyridoxal-phosphate dependent enzyme n=1 Tax=Streptantibioticus ferralitis TaxID=236510 RepID=A0ABT5YW92_9ACTN|nr:pyridoxal-phosphate dependent enzyme [Streptantibioticus ferralitis]MDF2255714.1 pyridoxal-phosphate dependent enzyme [Streptantibioticus ferralitis]